MITRDEVLRVVREAGFSVVSDHFNPEYAPKYPKVMPLVPGQSLNVECERLYRAAYLAGLEAAKRECDARYMGDNNREDMEARRCADAIQQLIDKEKRHDTP